MVLERRINLAVIIICFIFSLWLFQKSFGWENGQFRIARHVVGDFGLHLSLIRSVSIGNNFPPQSPFFPGRPLPYHWGVDIFVGMLEKIGIPIDIALNGVSAVSMTALLYGIYRLSFWLFKNYLAALVSIPLFLFPSTLTVIDYLKKPTNILSLPDYIHKGPFDGGLISIHQTLNPYLNQRHLVVGLAISIWLIQCRLNPIIQGIVIGLLFKIHVLVAISTFIVLLTFRRNFSLFLAIPIWLLFIFYEKTSGPPISIAIDFRFFEYWIMNAGLSVILIPFGLYLAPKKARILFISFLLIFLIASVFQVSFRPEHNHSLINFFWISVAVLVGYVISTFYRHSRTLATVLFLFLISSGVLNLMAVKNDFQAYFVDSRDQFSNIIPIDAIFFTEPTLYDPVTLSGRYTYVGPSYYLEVMGIDYYERETFRKAFFTNPVLHSEEAKSRGIDYYVSKGTIYKL